MTQQSDSYPSYPSQQTASTNSGGSFPFQIPPVEPPPPIRWFDTILNGLLAPNLSAGSLRFLVLVLGPVIVLFFLSWIKLPLLTKENWPILILFVLPFLIAFEGASLYIQSLYGLETLGLARRVLLASAFGLAPDLLQIRNGINPMPQQNRILRVGGPGFVQVSDENAGLFEKPDGIPYIIGPTTRPLFNIQDMNFRPIGGFDRLRQVVDLRDHIMEWEVKARTRDGIVIKASNLQIVFSIRRRAPSNTTGATARYSYSPLAILRLVYQQQLNDGALDAVIQPLIRNEFRALIENKTLKELLTSIRDSDTTRIDPMLLQRYVPSTLPQQTSRPQISGIFTDLTRKFARDTFGAGIQLEWINVGVWQFDADRIIQQHVDAWRMEFESRNLTAAVPTARLQQDILAEEMKFQLQEIIRKFAALMMAKSPHNEIIYKMLSYFYGKIRTIRNSLPQAQTPEIDETLRILKDYLDTQGRNRSRSTFVGPTDEP